MRIRETSWPHRTWGAHRCGRLVPKQAVDEPFGVKWRKVVRALTEAHELDGHTQRLLNGQHDAALGSAVHLCQDDACQRHGFPKDLRLRQTVLAGGRIDDEEDLARLSDLGDNAVNLAELIHEASLVLETARGVDEDDVNTLVASGLSGFESD